MKNRIWVLLLVILGFTLTITAGCEKDEEIPSLTVKDIEGNVYHIITIGKQVWMVENLKTTKYNDGTAIPLATAGSELDSLSTPGGYCWYNNDEAAYKSTYGALYNWYTVNTGKLCPTGWHVPTDAEWTVLTDFLGGEDVAGGKLKEAGFAHWNDPNTAATNVTGFSGLPGGIRGSDGAFAFIGNLGYWWSTTENHTYGAWSRGMLHNGSYVRSYFSNKQSEFSVRCLQN